MTFHSRLIQVIRFNSMILLVITFISTISTAQDQVTVDGLKLVDTQKHVLSGNWTVQNEEVRVDSDGGKSICVLPYEVTGSYDVAFEFTRKTGTEVVGLILPLVEQQVFLELSGWSGESHGLSRINQASTQSEANPTAVRPGTLENNQRYRVAAAVDLKEDKLTILVRLNDKEIIRWTGNRADAEANVAYNIGSNRRFALATSSSAVTFHTFKIEHPAGRGKAIELNVSNRRPGSASETANSNPIPGATMKRVPAAGGKIDLTNIIWQDRRGQLDVVTFRNEKVVRLQGQDNTVALLPGSLLGDGEIQVEIASDTFSGIAVRASDVNNYDLLYFRPQNSGTAKHDKTVQYVCKGREGADWRTLREKFPGMYEAGADMKINEWFQVRLVLKGPRLAAYVGQNPQPALVVENMLGEKPTGQLGLWGWNSHFRNFSFKPAD